MMSIVVQGSVRNPAALEKKINDRLQIKNHPYLGKIELLAMTQTQGDNGVITVTLIVEERAWKKQDEPGELF